MLYLLLFSFLSSSLISGDVGIVRDSSVSIFIHSTARYQLSSSLQLSYGAVFKYGSSPQYPVIKWEKLIAGDWNLANLAYRSAQWQFLIGRWQEKWSYSNRYSLILNDTLPARNGFEVKFKHGKIGFEYFISSESSFRLNRDFLSRGGDSLRKGDVLQRSLIGHKVEWSGESFKIYFSEVAYCASKGYLPNIKYLNPFLIYFLLQFNDAQLNDGIGVDANILWDMGFWVNKHKTEAYGELLIDDFQYKKVPTKEPPQIGFLFGFRRHLNKNFSIVVEYTRIWAWTYLHENPWESYKTLGFPLGHPYGPDFDEMYVDAKLKLSKYVDTKLEFSLKRKGEVNINTKWPIKPYGDRWEKFPSGSDFLVGIVEHSYMGKINFNIHTDGVGIFLYGGVEKINNFGHQENKVEILPKVGFSLYFNYEKKS